jgi:hypothetical protein
VSLRKGRLSSRLGGEPARQDPLAFAKREVLMERGLYRGYKLRSAAPLEAKDGALPLGSLLVYRRCRGAPLSPSILRCFMSSEAGPSSLEPHLSATE